MKARIFVEGRADKKFIQDFIGLLMPGDPDKLDIIAVGGWTNIPKVQPKFEENSNDNGSNLVIFDADNHPERRRQEILNFKDELAIDFELFLLPNNRDRGQFETLLCNLINQDHQVIFNCFENYQICLEANPQYHLPNLKSKIYAYLEALLPNNQKEMIKEAKRDYQNRNHWDLENAYLNPLRRFLESSDYDFYMNDY